MRGARQALGMEPPAGPVGEGGGAEPNAAVHQAPANAVAAGEPGQAAGEGTLPHASDTHHHPGRLTTELGKPDPAANREAAAAVHPVPPPTRRPAPRPPVPDCFLCPLTLEVGLALSVASGHSFAASDVTFCGIPPPQHFIPVIPGSQLFLPAGAHRYHMVSLVRRDIVPTCHICVESPPLTMSLCTLSGVPEPSCCR